MNNKIADLLTEYDRAFAAWLSESIMCGSLSVLQEWQEKRSKLLSELERVEQERKSELFARYNVEVDLRKVEEERDKAIEGLRWYAEKNHLSRHWSEDGDKARSILSELEP